MGVTQRRQDEFDAGRAEDFKEQLPALERAQERLAAGTYGQPIEERRTDPGRAARGRPDCERTVEEEADG